MTHILDRPAQFQWDQDSVPYQAVNCGPTCIAMIAGFYRDKHYSPAYMRKLATGSYSTPGPTTTSQMVRGLAAVGISASRGWKSVASLKMLLGRGIPVLIIVDYGKFPNDKRWITDFGFNGYHYVVACKAETRNGVPGILVRDPDHGSPARPWRPPYIFWPDSVWVPAFVVDSARVFGSAVWPISPKR